jgi:hypothetical protein
MFNRSKVPAFVATQARFGQRAVAPVQAAREVPAHVAAEWTGSQERPQGAAERVRALLA